MVTLIGFFLFVAVAGGATWLFCEWQKLYATAEIGKAVSFVGGAFAILLLVIGFLTNSLH